MALMESLDLLEVVFLPSEVLQARAACEGQVAPQRRDLILGMARARLVLDLLGPETSKQDARVAAYAALLSPYAGLHYLEKKKQRPLAHGILRVGLRLGNDV